MLQQSIVFISPGASVYAGFGSQRFAGGAEKQLFLLSETLAEYSDWTVALWIDYDAQPRPTSITYGKLQIVPVVSRGNPLTTMLNMFRQYTACPPGYVVLRSISLATILVGLVVRFFTKSKLVYWLAHDIELIAKAGKRYFGHLTWRLIPLLHICCW